VSQDDSSIPAQMGNPEGWAPTVSAPVAILRFWGLSTGAITVYLALLVIAKGRAVFQSSIAAIGGACCLSYSQTRKHLEVLKGLGLVRIKRQYNAMSIYTLTLHPILLGEYPAMCSKTSICRSDRCARKRAPNTEDSFMCSKTSAWDGLTDLVPAMADLSEDERKSVLSEAVALIRKRALETLRNRPSGSVHGGM